MLAAIFDFLRSERDTANAIAALASAVTAVIALFVALWAAWTQRKHNVLSVRPIPEVTVADYEDSVRVKLRNNGSGPMIIESLTVKRGAETKDSIIEWMPELPDHRPWTHFSMKLEGRTLQADGVIPLIELSSSEIDTVFIECRSVTRQALKELTVQVNFTDIYGSRLKPYTKNLSWYGRHD